MLKKLIVLVSLTLFSLVSNTVLAQETEDSTTSGDINPDTIKENIKKRIEQVIKDQKTDQPQKKVAYLGTISSMTPNSISLETIDGDVEQASTSGDTIYVETKTSKEVKREDASIGDFVAALGFMETGVDVLDARRLLILRDPPKTPKKTSFFGTISAIDIKKNQIKLTSPLDNQTKAFALSTKSKISASKPNSLTNQELTIEELNLGQLGLVVYSPAVASTSASPTDTLLIKLPAGNPDEPPLE